MMYGEQVEDIAPKLFSLFSKKKKVEGGGSATSAKKSGFFGQLKQKITAVPKQAKLTLLNRQLNTARKNLKNARLRIPDLGEQVRALKASEKTMRTGSAGQRTTEIQIGMVGLDLERQRARVKNLPEKIKKLEDRIRELGGRVSTETVTTTTTGQGEESSIVTPTVPVIEPPRKFKTLPKPPIIEQLNNQWEELSIAEKSKLLHRSQEQKSNQIGLEIEQLKEECEDIADLKSYINSQLNSEEEPEWLVPDLLEAHKCVDKLYMKNMEEIGRNISKLQRSAFRNQNIIAGHFIISPRKLLKLAKEKKKKKKKKKLDPSQEPRKPLRIKVHNEETDEIETFNLLEF